MMLMCPVHMFALSVYHHYIDLVVVHSQIFWGTRDSWIVKIISHTPPRHLIHGLSRSSSTTPSLDSWINKVISHTPLTRSMDHHDPPLPARVDLDLIFENLKDFIFSFMLSLPFFSRISRAARKTRFICD